MAEMKGTTYPSYETLRVSFHCDYVLHVEINRPDKLNAMNQRFWVEIRNLFTLIRSDSQVRVVVLSGGSSRVFSSGLDLLEYAPSFEQQQSESRTTDVARVAIKFRNMVDEMQESFTVIEKCDKPVVCAIHGACIGGGIDLITACDIRYATKDAKFSIKEVDIGMAADVGTLQRLPKVCGNDSWIRELAYTARMFSGQEALANGLVSKAFDGKEQLLAAAFETAGVIAAKSPVATLGTKHLLNFSRDHTVEDGLLYVSYSTSKDAPTGNALWSAAMTNTKDMGTAIKANLQKKSAVFPKL
ncbi:putative enoyl CoA hydratase [Borealophlyctis nickersoniae]|nr:putative enoyl CoA hydratase [Borealophlyctis nickersoniae]